MPRKFLKGCSRRTCDSVNAKSCVCDILASVPSVATEMGKGASGRSIRRADMIRIADLVLGLCCNSVCFDVRNGPLQSLPETVSTSLSDVQRLLHVV